MHGQHQWWRVLVAAVLGGLVGVTAVAAAGEQFLPVLSTREGALRSIQTPLANGFIDYVTLLNERDGGINGVSLVWEECETVFDVPRGIECYERLKGKGPAGAAVFHMLSTPLTYALLERGTQDGRWWRWWRPSMRGRRGSHRGTARRHGPPKPRSHGGIPPHPRGTYPRLQATPNSLRSCLAPAIGRA
jgi:hypothetical protein